jgi:hypothetical protein
LVTHVADGGNALDREVLCDGSSWVRGLESGVEIALGA